MRSLARCIRFHKPGGTSIVTRLKVLAFFPLLGTLETCNLVTLGFYRTFLGMCKRKPRRHHGKKENWRHPPPALHDSIKILSTRLGIHVEEAYAEALQEYLNINGGGEARELSAEAVRLARNYDLAATNANQEVQRALNAAVLIIEAFARSATVPSPSRSPARRRR